MPIAHNFSRSLVRVFNKRNFFTAVDIVSFVKVTHIRELLQLDKDISSSRFETTGSAYESFDKTCVAFMETILPVNGICMQVM